MLNVTFLSNTNGYNGDITIFTVSRWWARGGTQPSGLQSTQTVEQTKATVILIMFLDYYLCKTCLKQDFSKSWISTKHCGRVSNVPRRTHPILVLIWGRSKNFNSRGLLILLHYSNNFYFFFFVHLTKEVPIVNVRTEFNPHLGQQS